MPKLGPFAHNSTQIQQFSGKYKLQTASSRHARQQAPQYAQPFRVASSPSSGTAANPVIETHQTVETQPSSFFGWMRAGASSLVSSVIGIASRQIGRVTHEPTAEIDFEKEAAKLQSCTPQLKPVKAIAQKPKLE